MDQQGQLGDLIIVQTNAVQLCWIYIHGRTAPAGGSESYVCHHQCGGHRVMVSPRMILHSLSALIVLVPSWKITFELRDVG